jgi:acyl carrier protein
MTEPHRSRSVEQIIAGYWRELLGAEAVSSTDDFIQLGGNSMLATMLANRIEDELGVRPEIVDLFATLGQLAHVCEALLDARASELQAGGEA